MYDENTERRTFHTVQCPVSTRDSHFATALLLFYIHRDSTTLYQCYSCPIIFGDATAALGHQESCNGEYFGEIYVCEVCELQFAQSDVCDNHSALCGATEISSSTTNTDAAVEYQLLDIMENTYQRFKTMTSKQKNHHWEEVGSHKRRCETQME